MFPYYAESNLYLIVLLIVVIKPILLLNRARKDVCAGDDIRNKTINDRLRYWALRVAIGQYIS